MEKVSAHTETINLVDVKEFLSLILECISSPEYKDQIADRSPEFIEGAMWGASFCALYANINSTYYCVRKEDIPNEV
jgi:hypothetical protein